MRRTAPDLSKLRLSEVHYHPRDDTVNNITGDSFEFIEFKNIGDTPIDLSGTQLSHQHLPLVLN